MFISVKTFFFLYQDSLIPSLQHEEAAVADEVVAEAHHVDAEDHLDEAVAVHQIEDDSEADQWDSEGEDN